MEVGQQERNLAMVVHGLVAVTGLAAFVPSLGSLGLLASIATVVLYFVWKSKGEFVARHAKQAAGLQVILFIIGVILTFVVGGAIAATAVTGGAGAAVAMGGLVFLIGLIIGIAALALGIMGLLKAQQGQAYTYPVVGSWIENVKV